MSVTSVVLSLCLANSQFKRVQELPSVNTTKKPAKTLNKCRMPQKVTVSVNVEFSLSVLHLRPTQMMVIFVKTILIISFIEEEFSHFQI